MSNRFVSRFKSTVGALAAAVRVGSAVENGDRPRRKDLDALGIDPAAFRSIGR